MEENTQRLQPFSQVELNKIFAVSPKHPDRLVSRESNRLEFKESFNFGGLGKYIRTAAGFANAKGGYIVYGIGRGPHTLLGINEVAFSKIDPDQISAFLNDHFDPAIEADIHITEIGGKSFGLIYFHESKSKPVICRKSADDGRALKEGEIYYRYRGRTQTIRHAELKELIDERRRHEQLLWFKHLKEIARIGVADAALLNLRTGSLKGTGGSVLIDHSLLPQISFIREGEFNQTKGKPTLKLIGNVEAIDGKPIGSARVQVVKSKGIRSSDIVLSFLNSENVKNPSDYLSQIAWEASAFLPVYYYLHLARLNLSQAIALIEEQASTSPAKHKLLKRLNSSDPLGLSVPVRTNKNGQRKLVAREKLLGGTAKDSVNDIELSDTLDMIRTINKNDLSLGYLKKLLLGIFNRNFARHNQETNDRIRRAVCYIDSIHFKSW